MLRFVLISLASLTLLTLSACNGQSAAGEKADYDTTKKMVVDILQTEDGKKALTEILSDEKMKQQLVIQADVVKKSLNEVLASDKGKEMWKKLFSDPEFVKTYAKSMSDEQKKLMKELMNDSDFQKQMLDLLQNPEISDQILEVLKGQKFRAHLEETIKQTLETPLFQAKITDILLKAAEEQGKQKDGGKAEQSGGGDQQQQGQGQSGQGQGGGGTG
ncbi:spore germination lipoprotein GerD [Virgibacillus oceani]|uniref:Germination protein n=1 Tax=Virgibacillus oceani TaxID=1479511 RepID=A0A917M7L3_9BACI|nr:spore germination lipoprotein GerD [Virgibacillus oceani]GGG84295.1 germination protein [Virgibacillus oceani]